MNMTVKLSPFANIAILVGALSVCCTIARAQAAPRESDASFHADVEVDPFAYVFGGYSVHVGAGYRGLRFALNAFAIDMPGFLEPNDGLNTSRHGFGFKAQYFPFGTLRGAFIGLQADLAHELVESEASAAAHRERQLSLGANLGYRFVLGDFHITPWLLLNYTPGARDVNLDGEKHEASRFFAIPTVHIGYRFL